MISDEYIIDTINYQVLQQKAHLTINNILYSDRLEIGDIELLEKYAPRLFNTYKNIEELEDVLSEFVKLYYLYRREFYNSLTAVEDGKKTTLSQLEQIFYDNSPIPNKKKTRDKQIESFKKHLNMVYNFLGGSRFGTEKGNKFKKQLKEICDNADEYIPKRTKVTTSTKPIKDYLLSLKLIGKSSTIDEFIKKLEKLEEDGNKKHE